MRLIRGTVVWAMGITMAIVGLVRSEVLVMTCGITLIIIGASMLGDEAY